VTELIAAYIAIYVLWTFLADVYGLLDQPRNTVWLSVIITASDKNSSSPDIYDVCLVTLIVTPSSF